MFEKKKCSSCGENIKDNWKFCPYCGEQIGKGRRESKDPFGSLFGNIDKEFEEIDKNFDGNSFKFPNLKIKPIVRGGGIIITVHSGTGMPPRVDVRTSGNYKKVEPEIKRRLKVGPEIEEVEEKKGMRFKSPKVTEEPETQIQNAGKKQIISIKLPDVKSEDDIEVRKLEQSVEIKALAGDMGYFKLIPIPSNATISKRFSNGVLTLEIER